MTAYNVFEMGFQSFKDYVKWLHQGPVLLELNRDVAEGEEIVVSYELPVLDADLIQSTKTWLEEQMQLMAETATVTPTATESEGVTSTAEESTAEIVPATVEAETAVSDVVAPPKFTNQPRVRETQNCGQCKRPTEKGHKCDVCKSWMHAICGLNFGDEEGEKELRRCTWHVIAQESETVITSSQKGKKQPTKSSKSVPPSTTPPTTRGAKLQSLAAAVAAEDFVPRSSPRKRKEVPVSAVGVHNTKKKKKPCL